MLSIESIINQTLDFSEHIQLILVNDGSQDRSEEICLKYKALYPDNIIYIYQRNSGVSSARNRGIEVAQGRYLNFMDADDKLSPETLYNVGEYMDNHYYEIDLVTIPLHFFDAQTGEHPLNNKFKGNRIIDIEEEFKSIVLSSSSSFIKRESIGELRFDETLKYGEDAHLINQVIMKKGQYGALSNCKYWYRKRNDGSSAIDNSGKTKDWYTEFLINGPMSLIEICRQMYGEVIKYIQFLVLYDLKWRVQQVSLETSGMTEKEKEEFIKIVIFILNQIDDEVIIKADTAVWYKIFMLKLKYNTELEYDLSFSKDNCKVLFKDRVICNLKDNALAIQVVKTNGDSISIEGYSEIPIDTKLYDVVAQINGKEIIAEKIERPDKDILALDRVVLKRIGFRLKININETNMGYIKLKVKMNRNYIRPRIWIDRNVRLYSHVERSYFVEDKYCIMFIHNAFVILPNTLKVRVGSELKFLYKILKISKRIAIYRIILNIIKKLKYRNIWLFMDRVDRADDNAEHLFKYANTQKDGIKKYFILSKESSDWERLSRIGNVIEYGSIKHKILYIISDKIISSHTADFARHQLGGEGILLRNLADFKFIFLQHGIIKDDLSLHLNRYNTQFSIFVTSTKLEYESILKGNYFYDREVIKLTGLPRYDQLINEDKKQILIIPTWKKDVVGPIDPKTKLRLYSPRFRDSEYFKIYNSLINDKRLIECAKKNGYKILFLPHPEIYQQIKDFTQNDYVKFVPQTESYQKLLRESSLLVTDYSSIAFDFAYMKKPVIYYQWYENHYAKGYFNYEIMGMGPVYKKYNELIDSMVEYIENSCIMQQEYVKRVDEFYIYTDRENCKRVYEEIRKI